MQKKIIAVACAVILVATVFASCAKKKMYTQEINGLQRPVVTDENGELVTNFEGEIQVYVTEENGEIVTNDIGEPNYNYVSPPAAYESNGKLNIEHFKINVPKDYTANDIGWLIKKKTEGKCCIKFVRDTTVSEDAPLQQFLDETIEKNKEVVKQINDGKFEKDGLKTAEQNLKDTTLWEKVPAYFIEYKITSTEGKVVHYAVNIYFLIGDDVYSANYACEDGVGYDESFDFLDWVQNNVEMKK